MVRVWMSVFRARGVLESARCIGASDNVRRCQSTKSYTRRHPARVLPSHLAAARVEYLNPVVIWHSAHPPCYRFQSLRLPPGYSGRCDLLDHCVHPPHQPVHFAVLQQRYQHADRRHSFYDWVCTKCCGTGVCTPCPEKMPLYFCF